MIVLAVIAMWLLLAFWQGLVDLPGDLKDWLPDLRPPEISVPSGPLKGTVDRIVIDKSDRMLIAVQDGKPARVYTVALGKSPEGDKQRQGDGRTPEGIYHVDRRNDRSQFHLSLGIDYPKPDERARAKAAGIDPGGDIFIHGQPNGRVAPGYRITTDWTDGCVALSDGEIEELFAATPVGTEVEIRP
ncbi:L,D-transpeptidase family protein [Paracoccus suum]|nr:L,D-transpeptidase family protein [Paracoccus suum]